VDFETTDSSLLTQIVGNSHSFSIEHNRAVRPKCTLLDLRNYEPFIIYHWLIIIVTNAAWVYIHSMLSAVATGRRSCLAWRIRWLRLSSLTWFLAVKVLETKFKLHNPPLLIIWTQFPCMIGQNLLAVAFQLLGKVCDLCLKLLFRFKLLVAFVIRIDCCLIGRLLRFALYLALRLVTLRHCRSCFPFFRGFTWRRSYFHFEYFFLRRWAIITSTATALVRTCRCLLSLLSRLVRVRLWLWTLRYFTNFRAIRRINLRL